MSPAQTQPPMMGIFTPAHNGSDMRSQPRAARESVPSKLPACFFKMFFCGHSLFTRVPAPTPYALSDQYLGLIKTCSVELDKLISEGNDICGEYEQLQDELGQVHIVWSFIHHVYLSSLFDQAGHPTNYLCQWFHENYPDAPVQSISALVGDDNEDDDYGLWMEIVKCIVYGDLEQCKKLLNDVIFKKQLNNDDWRQLTSMIHLNQFSSMNTINLNSISPFVLLDVFMQSCPPRNDQANFVAWQQVIKNLFFINQDLHLPNQYPVVKSIFKVLTGDILEIEDFCNSWQQMFITSALYCTNQNANFDLLKHASAIASSSFETPVNIAGGALVEATLGNLDQCITRLHLTMFTPWFSFHLYDVLVRCKKISDKPMDDEFGTTHRNGRIFNEEELEDEEEQQQQQFQRSQQIEDLTKRQSYMIDFAKFLILNRNHRLKCWRIVIDYCPLDTLKGNYYLSLLFSKLIIEQTRNRRNKNHLSLHIVDKLLNVCQKKKLLMTYQKMCEVIGNEYIKQFEFGKALLYYSRINDYNKCHYITKLAIKDAERGGSHSTSSRKLEGIGCAIDQCPNVKIRSSLQYASLYGSMQDSRAKLQVAYENSGADESQAETIEDEGSRFVDCIRLLTAFNGIDRQFWLIIAYEAAKVIDGYPAIGAKFTRKMLLELVAVLELTAGPYTPPELMHSLRIRISVDEGGHHNQQQQDNANTPRIVPCEMEKLQSSLDRCRLVLLQSLAKRINEC